VSPAESWAFIAVVGVLLGLVFIGAGRALDWTLDRLFTPPVHSVNRWEDACPCYSDATYHERKARGL
jgi:hypothetical protein